MYVCMYISTCMYVCMHVCMCMHASMYMYICIYMCVYVCLVTVIYWFVCFPQGIHLINQPNKEGLSPLHLSAKSGHSPVIEVLLSHGADINLKTSNEQTCLHLAAASCNDPDSKVEMTPDLSKVHPPLSRLIRL